MEDDMAPPNKRRRLSISRSEPIPSHNDLSPGEPTPTLLHSVEHLEHKSASPTAHTVPKRIEEIHLQIQERGLIKKNKAHTALYRRQGATAVTSLITTIDDLGNTITTEITIGATTTTPTSPADSNTTSTDSNTSNTDTGTTTDTTESPTSASSSVPSLSLTPANSNNSTRTAGTTKDSTHQTTKESNRKTAIPSIYTAVLSNDRTVTITRSEKPYVTTFAGGQTSTICDLHDKQCTLNSDDNDTSTPDDSTPASSAPPSTVSTAYPVGNPTQGTESASSSSSSAAAVSNNNDNNDSTPPPGTIAGGVVGGAAGLAIILLLALILLRWYKRRKQFGHHALPPASTITSDPATPTSRGPGMAERAGLRPLATAVPGFFRHQNRSDIEPPPSERSFQKVSGRKLPSAFSEGMSSADVMGSGASVPSTAQDRNFSSLSFYRDSHGFYGGEGDNGERAASPDDVPPLQSDAGGVMLSPGPQRRPTVHTGGPWLLTPSSSVPSTPNMQSPNLATIPGSPPDHHRNINRSSTPTSNMTDNRSSRFTEEV